VSKLLHVPEQHDIFSLWAKWHIHKKPKTPPEPRPEYDLYVRIPGEMKDTLKSAVELAHKMNLIKKPELALLINLLIGWGMNVLKRLWLDRMGCK
jgi:hypothetical protein